MKKIKTMLMAAIFIFSLTMKSQITGYELNNTFKTYRFTGEQANFTTGAIYLNLDTSGLNMQPAGYYITYQGSPYTTPCWMTWNNNEYKIWVDSIAFFSNVSYNPNDRDLVWKADKPSYSTTSVNDARYKSSSYTPTLTLTGNVLSAGGNSITLTPVTPTITSSNDIIITGTWPTINISKYVPTTYTVTRSLMTGTTPVTFSISTRQAQVDYVVNIDNTSTLASNQTMQVFAEYSTNGGTTWSIQDQAKASLSQTLGLTITLVAGGSYKVTGTIPGSAIVRIRTTGTGAPTYLFGKEIY